MRKDSFGANIIRERESASSSAYEEQISYGTYSGKLVKRILKLIWAFLAYGESPRKPLQENQSSNKVYDKTGELEAVKQQLTLNSIEYDKLLESQQAKGWQI